MVSCLLCKNQMRHTRHKSFHRFPKNPKRYQKWIECINMVNWVPKKYDRICSDHFEKTDFYFSKNKKRLKMDAVPNTNLKAKEADPIRRSRIESVKREVKREGSIHNSRSLRPLSESEKRMTRMEAKRNMTTERRGAYTPSLKSDNESTTYDETVPAIKDDQLEFLTIIDDDDDDDDSSVISKDEEKHQRKRSLSPLQLDRSSKVSKNSDNESSSTESDDHNSPFVLSTSDEEAEVKESSSRIRNKWVGQPRFFGDCSVDDMNNPVRARICWHIAKKTISDLKLKNKMLQRHNRRLTLKIECLRSLFCYLEENNFLNQYASAVIKAVKPEKTDSASSS